MGIPKCVTLHVAHIAPIQVEATKCRVSVVKTNSLKFEVSIRNGETEGFKRV